MTAEVLVDTNILVYAYDPRHAAKQRAALGVLRHLVAAGRGRISAQVLAEFFRVATARLAPPLTPEEAWDQTLTLARAWPVLPVTAMIVLEAARGVRDHRINYWDAQVWATARLNQIPLVLSEDFGDRPELEGVGFLNPFAPGFDLAALG